MPLVFYVQKILRALLTVWAVVTFVFIILRISGDAAIEILGVDIGPEAIEAFRRRWGLDRPIWEQYVIYFVNLAQGDFGISLVDGRPALEVVLDRVPKTLALMVPTTIITLGLGIPAGIYAALNRNSWIDRGTMAISVMSFSLPNFVVGIFLILLFSVTWRLLPTAGSETWLHYIMPVITMSTADAAIFARFSRSAMLEVLNQPYMRTALAKGIPWRAAVRRHAVPNTAIPHGHNRRLLRRLDDRRRRDHRERVRLAGCRALAGFRRRLPGHGGGPGHHDPDRGIDGHHQPRHRHHVRLARPQGAQPANR